MLKSAFRLLVLLGLLISPSAFAATISVGTISADATPGGINDAFTTIVNAINGNIEGSTDGGTSVSNLKADSVFEINMADDANPRVRDSELFNITVDSVSGGTLTNNTVVESGCVPATASGSLSSNVSACVVYVNGYRVSKGATSLTYSANMDTYVDISQTGAYTQSAVAIGATQPTVAANSSRLAKVTTNGTDITTVTTLFTTRVPGLLVPANYRDGLVVSRDSATTITVLPGSCEINNSMIAKTTTMTLTLTTAGDWAGGSSLRAANTYGFVGMDTSGNLKLHTTAPTNTDYAVSQTVGKKRYATWSATVYRILGWFFMDAAQNVENASNIKDTSVSNTIMSQDANTVAFTATGFTDVQLVNFYNSGGPIIVSSTVSVDATTGWDYLATLLVRDSTAVTGCGSNAFTTGSAQGGAPSYTCLEINRPQGTVTYRNRARVAANTATLRARNMVIQEQ